jgi:23S rRNA (pseudouridine1915-N3)-methyltransferase
MLSVTILCVGNLKEKYWIEASGEYLKRLGRFCKIQIIEVAEEKCADNPSSAQILSVIEKEGERLLSKIPQGAKCISLCIEGRHFSSKALSLEIEKCAVEGVSRLYFVIGGSFGLSDAVKSKSMLRLSMSEMTFPHQLARVMLLEQIYRAFQISTGGKYHK